jgi:DNA-binding MurR/RpiR family transcriptional regulator
MRQLFHQRGGEGELAGQPRGEFVAELKLRYEGLPAQLKQAARWVIDHPADVALLSMRAQARRSGVAPATLTRLAQRFGLNGYDEVRRAHAEAVRERPENFHGRAQELLVRHGTDGDDPLARDVFLSLVRHLQALAAPAAIERIAAAAEIIAEAEHVFCLGQRSSFAVAFIFHYVRSLFGSRSILVDGPGATGRDSLRAIGRRDAMLAVTVDPYNRDTVETARYARSRGARVVAVSDSELSPLVAVAHRSILIGTETPSFFHTMTPAFAVAECLAALVAARHGEETLSGLAASQQQLAAFNTYMVRKKSRRART